MNNETERSISLKELFWYCLSYWKLFIVFALVGAIIGAAFNYIIKPKDIIVNKVVLSDAEKAAAEAVYAGYADNEAAKKELTEYKKLCDERTGTIPMWNAQMFYFASVVDTDANKASYYGDAIMAAYIKIMKSASERERIAEKFGMSAKKLADSFSIGDDSPYIKITIKGKSPKERKEVSELVTFWVEEVSNIVNEKIYPHTISCLLVNTYEAEDETELNQYIERRDELEGQVQAYESLVSGLQGDSEIYFTALTEGRSYDEIAYETVESVRTIEKKKVLLGALIGLVLVIMFAALRYILSSELTSMTALTDIFPNEYHAVVCARKRTTWLDTIIAKKQCGMKHSANEDAITYLCARVVDICRVQERKRVFITGSYRDDDAYHYTISELINQIGREGFECVQATNIVRSATSFSELTSEDVVLLIETYAESTYKDIEAEARIIKAKGNKLAGVLVLN